MQTDQSKTAGAAAVGSTRLLDGLSTRAMNRIYYACEQFGIPIEKVKEGIANHILKPAKWRDCGEKTVKELAAWAGTQRCPTCGQLWPSNAPHELPPTKTP